MAQRVRMHETPLYRLGLLEAIETLDGFCAKDVFDCVVVVVTFPLNVEAVRTSAQCMGIDEACGAITMLPG